MQFFNSNNLLLSGGINPVLIEFIKVLQAVLQFYFFDFPESSLSQFLDKLCPDWWNFTMIQYLNVPSCPERIKNLLSLVR